MNDSALFLLACVGVFFFWLKMEARDTRVRWFLWALGIAHFLPGLYRLWYVALPEG